MKWTISDDPRDPDCWKSIDLEEGDEKLMNNISPYRTQAMIKGPIDTRPKYGLIRLPKPVKPHKCSPPGFFKRLFYFFTLRPITYNSLWRCSYCKDVYMFENYGELYGLWRQQSSILNWVKNGGQE